MESSPQKNSPFTLVLPCYNPPANWEKNVVESVKAITTLTGITPELIIVNDGSIRNTETEKSEYIGLSLNDFKWISYSQNRGKGYALRQGVAEAKNDLVIYTDIDFPYLESSFVSLYQTLLQGHDVVPGHRGKDYYSKTPFLRKIISKFLRWTLKTFLRLPTDDSQCGIKGFNKKGASVFLDTKIDRFLFDLEFIKLASKRKLKIQTAEVELKPNIVFSKVSFKILFRESLNFMKVLFRK
ncbi:MAG: glycosyltransferase family 2 protein [Crocinitomicaceae bacterium]|nr:glycosyltransferase family 2 protein [Crocinitomicaceae bacterium]